MKRSGTADLTLMGGSIPPWLFNRMVSLCFPITEAIVTEYGRKAFLERLADPFWFQSFGAVIGMDWNSSGVTTAVLSALKKALNPHAKELGLYVCGGKGKDSLQTPAELMKISEQTGLAGDHLMHCSKLSAKVDNTAVQDGFQLYLHNFLLSVEGDWSVVQQGMKGAEGKARRYHWHSGHFQKFTHEPHSAICGDKEGNIINLVDKAAAPAQTAMLQLAAQNPDATLNEVKRLEMPHRKDIAASDVDLKRLGSILWAAQEVSLGTFDDLLLLKGMGPRTLQSLALVSEVIHGTPCRFSDPARFSFAHGGKGGRPFPVPTKVYDETINTLQNAVNKARLGTAYKSQAIKKLSLLAQKMEANFTAENNFDELIQKERRDSAQHGGQTVSGWEGKEV